MQRVIAHRDLHCVSISIHASHTGCNVIRLPFRDPAVIFQFMHPTRDATSDNIADVSVDLIFQFMHPKRDATRRADTIELLTDISIHASKTGCNL